MTQFTRQEKLALALTSAGSQRALARQLGVSHQQVGRWLREGEPLHIDAEGNIPTNKNGTPKLFGGAPEWIDDQLEYVFDVHKQVTREQARVDGVTFDATVPVYMERRYLSSGGSDWFSTRRKAEQYAREKHGPNWRENYQIEMLEGIGYRVRKVGDRVISGPTEFIREDMRKKWVRGMVASEKFYKVNVRSIIDLNHYFERVAEEELESGRRKRISKEALAYEISRVWRGREVEQHKRYIDMAQPFPLYTMSQDARPGSDPHLIAENVEFLLQQKHSSATGFPGTHFADEYLLQLLPANYVTPKPKPRKPRASRKPARKTRK